MHISFSGPVVHGQDGLDNHSIVQELNGWIGT